MWRSGANCGVSVVLLGERVLSKQWPGTSPPCATATTHAVCTLASIMAEMDVVHWQGLKRIAYRCDSWDRQITRFICELEGRSFSSAPPSTIVHLCVLREWYV